MAEIINLFAGLPDERKAVFSEKLYNLMIEEQERERAKAEAATAETGDACSVQGNTLEK